MQTTNTDTTNYHAAIVKIALEAEADYNAAMKQEIHKRLLTRYGIEPCDVESAMPTVATDESIEQILQRAKQMAAEVERSFLLAHTPEIRNLFRIAVATGWIKQDERVDYEFLVSHIRALQSREDWHSKNELRVALKRFDERAPRMLRRALLIAHCSWCGEVLAPDLPNRNGASPCEAHCISRKMPPQ